MTVWTWLRFTVTLWLLRKAFKLTGWLLLALLALVLWPVTAHLPGQPGGQPAERAERRRGETRAQRPQQHGERGR
jgi:hypothetical protein